MALWSMVGNFFYIHVYFMNLYKYIYWKVIFKALYKSMGNPSHFKNFEFEAKN